MSDTTMLQAWMGGTFDPVHNGHLRIALDVAEALGIRLNLLPCNVPPHAKKPLFTAQQRLALLERAVAEEPALAVDSRELNRSGSSYTVDTLQQLRDELGDSPLCWVMGYDSFVTLPSWSRWQQLLELANLVVCDRPGAQAPLPPELAIELEKRQVMSSGALNSEKAGKIWRITPTQLQISATDLRQRISAGRSLRYLLPAAVGEKITEYLSQA